MYSFSETTWQIGFAFSEKGHKPGKRKQWNDHQEGDLIQERDKTDPGVKANKGTVCAAGQGGAVKKGLLSENDIFTCLRYLCVFKRDLHNWERVQS